MQKLVLFLLPLIMSACIDRDRAQSRSAATISPVSPVSPSGALGTRGRGEGEGEARAVHDPLTIDLGTSTMGGANTFDPPDMPDRSSVNDLDGTERDRAGSSDLLPLPADDLDAGPGTTP